MPDFLYKIDDILNNMEKTLFEARISRPTALKGLQMEEQCEPFKILIGTILSARTRDENTTKALNKLFKRYKNVFDLAHADIEEVKKLIHNTGFYNVKAKRIVEVSNILIEKFGGQVPETIDELLKLPGVGRKTANCVLVYAFNKSAIPVDIHVHRISNRIGLVETKNPENTEQDLIKCVDVMHWLKINEVFVKFGQNVCLPIKPRCEICPLQKICNFYRLRI